MKIKKKKMNVFCIFSGFLPRLDPSLSGSFDADTREYQNTFQVYKNVSNVSLLQGEFPRSYFIATFDNRL